jgi:protein O-GlcNAc transferase
MTDCTVRGKPLIKTDPIATLHEAARREYHAGRFEQAEQHYRAALARKPGDPDTLSSLGVVLKDLGRGDEAIECWQRALRAAPKHALAHNNLGVMYRLRKEPLKAIEHLRRAILASPRDSMAAANLAHAYLDVGRIGEAEALARRITQRAPKSADGQLMLGFALSQQAEIEGGIAAFLAAHALEPRSPVTLCNALFASLYGDKRDGAALLAFHREISAQIVPAAPVRKSWPNTREPERRLRVGYLSADLRGHPVGYFIEPILENHDRAQVEVVCYSTTNAPDKITERLRPHATLWRECAGMPDERLVEAIAADRIDILVDLAGHTALNRIRVIAAKPAPVQVLYIGYPSTTGMAALDWLIADARVCPPGHERFYSERVARVEGSFWCYRPNAEAPEPGDLPALAAGAITFGSYNALPKLSETTVRLWTRVLEVVPGSRLVLKALPFADAMTRKKTLERFVAAGADPARVQIEPPTEPSKFLAEYRRLDIALDPVPYNGGTTTCEALWMGVPVVSLAGGPFFARMSASLLHSTGLSELVTSSSDDYVRAAADLAADVPRLAGIRAGLRARMAASPLCDGPRAAHELEQAYRAMWRDWITPRS